MKPNFFLLLLSLLFSGVFFSSCNQGNGKVVKVLHDSTGYKAPAAGALPKEEFDRYHNEIKDFYETKLVNRGFNGGILVAKKGQVIFEDYHGYADIGKKEPLTPHSAFHLASVSKTFTGMATLKLAEMGKLSLDDDVKKFFPSFPYDHVTIKLLLSHRSGLPNYLYFMDELGWDKKQHAYNEDVLDYLIKYKPTATRPDTHFTYCNTNYCLLGLIIEKASGKTYAQFLQEQFFTPLHMDDTYVFDLKKDSAAAMPSYDPRGRQEAFTYLDCGVGDKNIFSTPEDLLKWDQALYTSQLFSTQTLEAAFTPYSNEKPGIRNYGYGWRMNVYPNGKKVVYHNGWWHGNNTVFIRMIQDSVTIIVLGNKYNQNIYHAKDIEKFFDAGAAGADEDSAISKDETEANESPAPRKPQKVHTAAKHKPAHKKRR